MEEYVNFGAFVSNNDTINSRYEDNGSKRHEKVYVGICSLSSYMDHSVVILNLWNGKQVSLLDTHLGDEVSIKLFSFCE